MNRIFLVVSTALVASLMTGCNQLELSRNKAELALANAELAAMKSELVATRAELKRVQADLSETKAYMKASLQEREIEIKLPEAVAAQPLSQTPLLIIEMIQEGKYGVGEDELNERQLQTLLEQQQRNDSEQAVLIRGDGKLELRCVVQVMAMCNRAGIHNYSVALRVNE